MKAILFFIFLFGNFILLPDNNDHKKYDYSIIGNIDPESWKKFKIEITAKGTGNTTGNIANLTVQNNSDVPYLLDWETFFIPSAGEYQSYLVPEGVKQEIPPKSTVIVPVSGFCTDPTVPPVGSGEDFPPFEKWIQPIPELPNDWTPQSDNGWKSNPILINNTVVPGTDIPLTHTIHQVTHPVEFASLIDDVYKRIIVSIDSLRKNNLIHTPYSSNPKKEDTIMIQQTVWIFAYSVLGGSYEKEDFEKKIYTQFEEKTSVPVDKITVDKKNQLDLDISSLWDAFQLTGVEAKVLSKANTKSTDEKHALSEDQLVKVETCECDTTAFKLNVRLFGKSGDPGLNGLEELTYSNKMLQSKTSQGVTRMDPQKIHTAQKLKLETGDSIHLEFVNKIFNCKKCELSKQKCTPTEPNYTIRFGNLISLDDPTNTIDSLKTLDPTKAPGFSVPPSDKPLGIRIWINYSCQDPKCQVVSCADNFTLKLPRAVSCDCGSVDLAITRKVGKGNSIPDTFSSDKNVIELGKITNQDEISIELPKSSKQNKDTTHSIKAQCEACEGSCIASKIQYRVSGNGISGLTSIEKAKYIEYKPSFNLSTKIVKNLKPEAKTSEGKIDIDVKYNCEAKDCNKKTCEKRYTLKFSK